MTLLALQDAICRSIAYLCERGATSYAVEKQRGNPGVWILRVWFSGVLDVRAVLDIMEDFDAAIWVTLSSEERCSLIIDTRIHDGIEGDD